jgi:uncharacterized protein (DUF849 family)
MSQKLIINFSPTGMIPTKKLTQYAPVSVQEIVEDVHQAWELGIAMVHVHARDPITGEPTYKADVYGKIIGGIRKYAPELIVCVSLSGRNFKEFEKRSEPISMDGNLKPDMGSLTLSSLNFIKQASSNDPKMIQDLAAKMKERGIVPELEAFDSGMINYGHYLIKKGLIEPPYYYNLLLGNIANAQADLLHVGLMVRELPENSYWSLAGIGESQLMMNSVAIATGGGVRVGLEDNIYFDKQKTNLASNITFLRRIHAIAEANGRPIMTSKELRKLLNLKDGNGQYGR